ncbi:gliding motility-associated C-terminal domain-containing protein [Fluviicola sp.]|uniref:T9SS type B sorting domain-containing protein n=1 Tax=Fluviicola sp. TaxID=1917219 RepID=UPI003D2A7530
MKLNSFSQNLYWRATASNNLASNIGNWETAPGNGIAPGSALSASNNLFFPVNSTVMAVNLNGISAGSITVSSPGSYNFTGTGSFSGNITANTNAFFTGATVNLVGSTTKIINCTPNVNTTATYFGTLNCNEGTVNLTHDLSFTTSMTLSASFNSNGRKISSVSGGVRLNASPGNTINLSNSVINISYLIYTNTAGFTGIYTGTRLSLKQSGTLGSGTPDCLFLRGSGPAVSMQSITFAGGNAYQEIERGSSLGGLYDINLDTLIIDTRELNNYLFSGGNWNVNTLKFARTSNLSLNGTISFSNLITPTSCLGFSTINTSTVNTLSPISNSTINFYAVKFTGVGYTGGTNNNIVGNSGSAVSWTLPSPASQTFWWVGGVGDWLDPTQWSVSGSGGAPQTAAGCVPSLLDDVVFDANSFTAVGQTVNTMVGLGSGFALCRNITVTDPANEGKFNGIITIAGNANFTGANSVNSIKMVGKAVHTLQSGTTTYSGDVIFNGSGDFSLVDNVTCSLIFNILSGNFNANGKTITSNKWHSNGTLTRSININNSNIFIANESSISNVNLTSFSAVNSLITYTGTNANAIFGGAATSSYPAPNTILPIVQFNDVVFNGSTTVNIALVTGYSVPFFLDYRFNNLTCHDNAIFFNYGFTVNNLNLTAGKNYVFEGAQTFTILSGINTLNTTCGELLSLSSRTIGQPFRLFKASLPFTITNASIKDAVATGATLTVNNGVNMGNLTNIIVNPGVPRNFYWVNGTGNWSDGIGHWSIGVSGGNPSITNPGGCIPTSNDNVFFDGGSFSGMGQTVTLNVVGNCKNITWDAAAAAFAPVFSGTLDLSVYGSYQLSTGMVHNHTGKTLFYGVSTSVNGQIINTDGVLIQTVLRLVGGGRYDIRHNINSTGITALELNAGRLYTNGHDIRIGAVYLSQLGAGNFADISNSKITTYLSGYSQGGSGTGGWSSIHYNTSSFIATNSTITNGSGNVIISNYGTTPIDYHNLICSSTSSRAVTPIPSLVSSLVRFNKVDMQGGNSALNGNYAIDTLIYTPSSVNKLYPGYSYIVNDTLIAFGSPCNPLRIESNVAGTPVSFTNNGCNTEIKYGAIKDINANLAPGCNASDYLVYGSDNGGNSNWTFLPYASISGLGSDTTLYCTGAPYVLTTGNLGTSNASYLWSDGSTGTTFPVFQSGTYTLSTTFESGCTINNTITAIVLDTVAPTISGCNDTTFYLNNSCQYVVPDFKSTVSITDDCSGSMNIDYSQIPAAGTILTGQGNTIVKLYAEDAYGNIDSCSFNMSLLDNLPPTVICQNFTGALNTSGTLTITPATIHNGSNDGCGIASMTVFPNNFTCSNLGANTVTLTVTDVNGNASVCTSTVTVIDTIAPTVLCQNFTGALNPSGTITVTPATINNGSTDNCTIASMTVSPNLFTCANLGNNTVSLTVTDGSGNVSTCTSTVTVIDVVPPTAVCQNFTVNLDASGNASITTADIDNGSTDNCAIASISVFPTTFDCSNVGTNTVTLTVTDGSGNVSTCNATVTVVDSIPPVAICQNFTVALDASGNASITPSNINNGSTDICGVSTITVSPNSFNCSNLGANTVTMTVTDVNGNIATCTSTVTVEDNMNPQIINCISDTTVATIGGLCDAIVPDFTSNSQLVVTDNCSTQNVNITISQVPLAGSVVNANTIVWIYAADGSGNVDSCSFLISIEDQTNPIIVNCISDTTLFLGQNCDVILPDFTGSSQLIVTDNCSQQGIDITITQSISAGTLITANTVIWIYASDAAGNVDSCSFNVIVLDTIAPQITCIGDQEIAVDDHCEFALPDYNSFGIVVTDNCSTTGSNITVSQKPAPGTLLSKQIVVWLIAADNLGNVDSCSFTVNPIDCKLIFYESFSPGDKDGKNDYFVIEGIERFPNSKLIIFNRWGEAVFESGNYLNEWDGRSQSSYNVGGDLLPDGVYYYILELGNSNASIDNTYNGFVYLKR